MAFSELVKSFEKIRGYMREFYVYGFRTRSGFSGKSGRTYDNERRRLECVLGEHTESSRDSRGKNVFLSIDSRSGERNPLYRLLRTCSFTDRDITLHFLLMDMLDEKPLLFPEIMERLNNYTACFSEPMTFDESGVRKKLSEYEALGLIRTERCCTAGAKRRRFPGTATRLTSFRKLLRAALWAILCLMKVPKAYSDSSTTT